ncbi:hypothetical protein [Acanthopleuribacter pedis]|uniref:Uncharacterized protein n=1 Tax=Acanthopleuribacter pedis TaxID=442870 RepID=A0A8J7Q909_9BACT|nr:hypothetical protein [Acanthopleuribacter pedis]MBO1319947.1 hypothetical protein [Acanthopleuribacter pedis]
MLLSMLGLLFWQEPSSLFQIQFELKIFQADRRLSAQLVLSKAADDHFSIHCRKAPSGTLFTFWAQPTENTLALPKEKLAFVGAADERVVLFPEGPALTRAEWLALLEFGTWPDAPVGDWRFEKNDQTFSLRHAKQEWAIEWRVRKRRYKNKFSQRILTPSLGERYQTKPLAEVVHYWQQ